MTWADGSVSYFVRRQAPGLFLDHEGYPLYLLTPVDELSDNGCHLGHGWTLMQPVGSDNAYSMYSVSIATHMRVRKCLHDIHTRDSDIFYLAHGCVYNIHSTVLFCCM